MVYVAKLEAAVKFAKATLAYSRLDKPHLNNTHVALLLYLRVYPSEMCAVVFMKLSDGTASLLINNKLWALHCMILLTSLQTRRSIISFAFAEKLTF